MNPVNLDLIHETFTILESDVPQYEGWGDEQTTDLAADAPTDDAITTDEPIVDHAITDLPPKKRNSGKTGATSPAGRARSAQNALKHGSCSLTLILSGEDADGWCALLSRWCQQYEPAPDSLEYDFVLKASQSEWRRLRTQRNFDVFLLGTRGGNPFNWRPEDIRKHDLLHRYKVAAEREFQRNYRLLEQHYKSHCLKPKPQPASDPEPEQKVGRRTVINGKDPNSPTGYTTFFEFPPREGDPCPHPTPLEELREDQRPDYVPRP